VGKIEATVVCKGGYIGDLKNDFERLDVAIIPINVGYFNLMEFYRLYKIFRNDNFDSVCDFTGNFATVPLLLAKLSGIKKRIAFHRGSNNRFNETRLKLFYNTSINRFLPTVATNVLANSKAAMRFFHNGIWGDNAKFEVIYNGINASEFLKSREHLRDELQIPEHAFVIGHVGRYNEAKNHKTVIEVAISLCKEYKDTFFIFCGRDVEKELIKQVLEEKLENQIILLGYRRDVIKVLNTLDCFYFPSINEGQPNALIEAMIAGVPIVASDIDPIRETVPSTIYPSLVPPLNMNQAIAKILEIKKNRMDSSEIKEWAIDYFSARKWFEKFYSKL